MTADPARHAKASALFLAAREVEPAARAAYLERECGGDREMRRDVEALLAGDDDSFLGEAPLGSGAAAAAATEILDEAERAAPSETPRKLGPFRILSTLGEGGMGVVYAAEQENPRRRVALKVLRGAIASGDARRRFESESAVLARLRHPCIAQVYEVRALDTAAGETTPYFVMELIEGARPITQYANEERLDLERRLELFARVLDGVHHGHQRGVVHRDLKPQNILVDADGNPKIIDFGVARIVRADETIGTVHTMAGQLLGTLEYMSPEHVSGDPDDVDSRADVYSMGVVLFELVSGQLPFALPDRGVVEAIRAILDAPPRRLSTLHARWHGDLDTIVDKALSKDRDRRYASASELAADVRRFLRHEAIAARPAAALYQIRLFARRNRTMVVAAAAVLAALVAGLVVSARFAFIADERADASRREAYRSNLKAAGLAIDAGQLPEAREYLEAAAPELRGWEWRHYRSRTMLERASFAGLAGGALAVDERPGGDEIAVVWSSGDVHVLRAPEERRAIDVSDLGTARHVYYSSDGGALHVLARRPDSWGCATFDAGGRRTGVFRREGSGLAFAAFHDESGRLACVTDRGAIEVVDARDGTGLATRDADEEIHSLPRVAFSSDGRTLAVSTRTGGFLLLDASTLAIAGRLGENAARAIGLAFDASGGRLAAGREDGAIALYDLAGGGPPRILKGHGGPVVAVAFHPDGSRLFSASYDSTFREFDPSTGACRTELRGGTDWAEIVEYSRDVGSFVVASRDGTVRAYDVDVFGDSTVLRGHASYVNPVAVSADGSTLVSGGWDGYAGSTGAIRFWDALTGDAIGAWPGMAVVVSLAADPKGGRVLAGTLGAVLDVDLDGGDARTFAGDLEGYATVAISPDGSRVAVGENSTVSLFDARTGGRIGRAPRSLGSMTPPLFTHDGSRLAITTDPGRFAVLDGWTLSGDSRVEGEGEIVAFSSDDRRAVAVTERDVRILDATRGFAVAATIPVARAMRAAFSPEDERLFVGCLDGRIRIHDGRTYAEVASLQGHTGYVFSLTFAAGGQRLFTGSGDGTIRLFETRPTAERVAARRERAATLAAVAPRVRALFDAGLSPRDVAARLRAERWTSDRERAVALQAALGEALGREGSGGGGGRR